MGMTSSVVEDECIMFAEFNLYSIVLFCAQYIIYDTINSPCDNNITGLLCHIFYIASKMYTTSSSKHPSEK